MKTMSVNTQIALNRFQGMEAVLRRIRIEGIISTIPDEVEVMTEGAEINKLLETTLVREDYKDEDGRRGYDFHDGYVLFENQHIEKIGGRYFRITPQANQVGRGFGETPAKIISNKKMAAQAIICGNRWADYQGQTTIEKGCRIYIVPLTKLFLEHEMEKSDEPKIKVSPAPETRTEGGVASHA